MFLPYPFMMISTQKYFKTGLDEFLCDLNLKLMTTFFTSFTWPSPFSSEHLANDHLDTLFHLDFVERHLCLEHLDWTFISCTYPRRTNCETPLPYLDGRSLTREESEQRKHGQISIDLIKHINHSDPFFVRYHPIVLMCSPQLRSTGTEARNYSNDRRGGRS